MVQHGLLFSGFLLVSYTFQYSYFIHKPKALFGAFLTPPFRLSKNGANGAWFYRSIQLYFQQSWFSMNKITLDLTIPMGFEIVLTQVSLRLIAEGMSITQTFELDSACALFNENHCPHGGNSPCQCRLVVLMVSETPLMCVSLVFHGHDKETEIWIFSSDPDRDPGHERHVAEILNDEFRRLSAIAQNGMV
ncbi:MAG TPA: hypothetical protein VJL34_01465 [Anaerolineales bacterium]|nr:hypothetical protein [Anaerolineales bacterium]